MSFVAGLVLGLGWLQNQPRLLLGHTWIPVTSIPYLAEGRHPHLFARAVRALYSPHDLTTTEKARPYAPSLLLKASTQYMILKDIYLVIHTSVFREISFGNQCPGQMRDKDSTAADAVARRVVLRRLDRRPSSFRHGAVRLRRSGRPH